jgi:hypothetical protein
MSLKLKLLFLWVDLKKNAPQHLNVMVHLFLVEMQGLEPWSRQSN